ncbi:PsbP [Seminavis robusta]|uniref:PsbP n=1 Tax=Seminavis robusta TaxID=568900 RepID=A0A9N8DU97_9STRA|nr:PsbP [Seminavis robusta]|eukprot:Sro361_g126430.1 PsbP (291) ;mRNA; r:15103-15975
MRIQAASLCFLLAGVGTTAFQTTGPTTPRFGTRINAVDDPNQVEDDTSNTRRKLFLAGGSFASQMALLPVFTALADEGEGDMTTQLFNPDGSLKGEVEEAKFRSVSIAWDGPSEKYFVNVDGANSAGTNSGSEVRLSYKVPEKWQQKDDGYFDKSTTNLAKACQRIFVYRAPGKVTPDRLAKAATIGIADALYVTDDLKELKGADLLSGRSRKQGDIKFYDFDMALAPKTCGDSKENLGLGFCPFESIYLLSAAVLDDALYVLALECDKSEWKVANSDLKRVRSSFAFDV